MSRPTDHRNLNLVRFNEDVAFHRANGRILWQPRILAWYTDRKFSGRPLPAPYTGMTEPELYRALGVSNRLYFFNRAFLKKDPPTVVRKDVKTDDTHTRHTIETPVGVLSQVTRRSENHWDVIPEKWWIETPQDLNIATWIMHHTDWTFDRSI